MKEEEVVKMYNSYRKTLKYMTEVDADPQSIDTTIFAMCDLLQNFLNEVSNRGDKKSTREVQKIIGQILDGDLDFMSDYICDFIRMSNTYINLGAFQKNPDTVLMLYNKFSKRLCEQLPKEEWGDKTKDVIYNSLMELDKMVITYAKSIARKGDIKAMEKLIDLTSGGKLNVPIIFQIINEFSGKDKALDKKMNSIMEKNKLAFAKWSIIRKSGRAWDLIERPSMMSDYLKKKRSRISDRYGASMQMIIDELVKSEGVRYVDIKLCGEGGYAVAYKIGDKVLKIGTTRETKKIPYHKRIIQPLLRQDFESRKDEKGKKNFVDGRRTPGLFVEVTDRVDINPSKCKGKMLEIFKEMYRDGVVWTDAKVGNVGILRKDNVPNLNGEKMVVDSVASGMTGQKKEKPLGKGDIVIIDTDFIYKVGDPNMIWGVDDSGCTDIAECKKWYEEQERKRKKSDPNR